MSSQVVKHVLKLGLTTVFVSSVGLSAAYASGKLGADVVACFKEPAQAAQVRKNQERGLDPLTGVLQDLKSVDLLDMYEAKNNPFGNLLINPQGQTYLEILEVIMDKVKKTSGAYPLMEFTYKQLMEASVSSPGGVADLDDANEKIVVPGNCSIIQLAVQERDYRTNLESFSVNTTLFQALKERDKAALFSARDSIRNGIF